MVDVTFSLTGSNADSIVFDFEDYVLNTGLSGISAIPATQVRIDPSAGDGGLFRGSKRGVRDIDLPITIFGTDRADVENKLRRLARLSQDANGETTLKANYSDGTTLSIGLHYVGGAEAGNWGSETGMTWCSWVMSFQAPIPFWESQTPQTFQVTSGSTGRGLLPQLSKMKVSSSQALGNVTITNTGDVASFPTWQIVGPINNLIVSNGTQSFGFNAAISAGETITINTFTGQVTNQAGTNRYALLSSAPKFFSFQPGSTVLTISGTEATAETLIGCTYALRYEVVH